MCQLTLLDIDPKTKLGKATIRNLMELNQQAIVKYSGQTNADGFGYMTFAKAPEINKTGKSAVEWWHQNWEKYQKSVRNPNGIYHVRAASVNTTTIFEEDAHPFNHGNIILAHNGTMIESEKLKNDKILQNLFDTNDPKEPMIDSEKFCVTLAHIVGDEKLTTDHIISAMEYFHGPFAMLIYDIKQSSKLYIIRGKDRPLHMAEIYKDEKRGERVGVVLNTQLYELMYWSKMVKSISKEYLGMDLHIGITLLAEESIFEYKIGSYDLGEMIGEIKQTSAPVIVRTPANKSRGTNIGHTSNWRNSEYNDGAERFVDFYNLCSDLGMNISELFLLAEHVLGVSLHCMNEEQMEYLRQILVKFVDYKFDGREKVWKDFLKDNELYPIPAYKQTDISFPFFLMSKKLLTKKMKKYVPSKQEKLM